MHASLDFMLSVLLPSQSGMLEKKVLKSPPVSDTLGQGLCLAAIRARKQCILTLRLSNASGQECI